VALVPLSRLSARHRLAVIAVIAVAAALRFGAIGAGAPYRIANDEPFVVGMALKILQSGDFNPHFFHYGGLAIYLHTAVAVVRFLAGALSGEFTSVNGIWIGDFLTSARIVTAALGTLTVWLVYLAGMRLGPRVALLAAFIMAVLPQHVRESHFALTDTPLTLLVTAALVLSLRATEQSRLSALATAAFVVGLAAAVKYNGALALIMPLLAGLVMPPGSRLRGMGLVMLCAGGGFLVASPYTVLDLPAFLNDFARLSQSYNQGRPFLDASAVYVKHLRNWFAWTTITPLDAGMAALALGLIGGWLIALRRNMTLSRTGAAIVLVFPILWFVVLARQGSLQYGRYLLPLAPMLCLAVATTLAAGWARSNQLAGAWRWGLRAGIVAVLLLPTGAAVSWVRDHARPRTEELASAWLVREMQAGQQVVVEAAALLLPPSITVQAVDRLVDQPLSDYVDRGVTYLVTTSAETDPYFARPAAHADELSAYRQLTARTEPVATFVANAGTLGPTISILRVRP
jgi:4-amino-4-deoxy-L-arabinose transferase-like glycosyltransferase